MHRILIAALLFAGTIVAVQAQPVSFNTDENRVAQAQTAAEESQPGQAWAEAQPRYASARHGQLGGGFIEFLFGGLSQPEQQSPAGVPTMQPLPQAPLQQQAYAPAGAAAQPMDPQFLPQVVPYDGTEKPGTVIVDTPDRFLFLVEPDGKARRYGIGVGRPGFTWAGEHKITAKREWPDWRPPADMLKRRPDLPHFMAGGPHNPLGARALYIGSTLYRIHGSNEPWTIGHAVSSGCIRMRNQDVIDLYGRVGVGTKVVVI